MAENASEGQAAQVADAKAADATQAGAGQSIDALVAEAQAAQHAEREASLEREIQSVIDASNSQGEDLKGTFTETDAEGKQVTYDLSGNVVREGDHPAAGEPKDPATAPKADEKPDQAPAQTEQPADAQAADKPKVAEPKAADSVSATEHALAQLRAENARLRAAAQAGGKVGDLKPDLSDEPDWEDGTKFPTPEAASEARQAWFRERYQKAAQDAVLAQHDAAQQAIQQAAQAASRAEAERVHSEVRTRLGLDDATYRGKMAQLGEITHPDYNPRFKVRNPVGHLLTNMKGAHLQNLAASGMDTKGHDTLADVHAAQISDNEFARKVASLPVTHEAAALVTSAAQQARTVDVLKHLVSDEGRADRERMLRPNTPPEIIQSEVWRIAAALPERKAAAVQDTTVPATMKQPVPTLPTPGRGQVRAAVAENLDTPEGQDALFRRLQAEADKSGSNGWRTV